MQKNNDIIKENFERLFRTYFVPLSYFASKYVNDLDDAKEIVHNVFLRIWENRDSFDWNQPAKSYLYTAVYKRSLNHIRDRKKMYNYEIADLLENYTADPSYETNIENSELEFQIRTALNKLPGRCREIFELSRSQGKKYSEIASILDLSVKTVEAQMSKALQILRTELKDFLLIILIMLKIIR